MLDQQPLRSAGPLHAYQHPPALQALAVQHDLEIAFLIAAPQRLDAAAVFGLVRAAIPQHHRAAAVLAAGMVPSKVLYEMGWSSTSIANRRTLGSRLGPFGTAQDFITPSSSSRKS